MYEGSNGSVGNAARAFQGATALPPVAQPTEIGSQLNEQEKGLEVLHQTIEALSMRLDPVLLPSGPGVSGGRDREALGSGLANRLNAHNHRLSDAIARLADLSNRVAL